ncbi:YihY/virulence factor BrkB family protein [Patescibacteria group bacterium]
MKGLLKETYTEWRKEKTSFMAASLAFYMLFSLAPVLVIIIAITGIFFGEQATQGEIVAQIQSLVGREVASAIQIIIENAHLASTSLLFTLISIGVFLFGATRVFSHLKYALNTIWAVDHKPPKKIHRIVKSRFVSVLFVLGLAVLFVLFLILNATFATLGVLLASLLPLKLYVFQVLQLSVSFLLITLIFAMVYRFVPDVRITWKEVWVGAAFTTTLFMLGNMLIGLYMRNLSIESVYGAAGSIIIILFWLYYCAQIFLIGAEFTKVYAKFTKN